MRTNARLPVCALILMLCSRGIPLAAQAPAGTTGHGATSYKAAGEVDPAAVRAVVSNLGEGRHVRLENSTRKWNGRIVTIDTTGFRFAPDPSGLLNLRKSAPFDVPFSDVRAVRNSMSPAKSRAISAAVVGAGTVLALVWAEIALN